MSNPDPIDHAAARGLAEQLADTFEVDPDSILEDTRRRVDPQISASGIAGSEVRLFPVSTFILRSKDTSPALGYVVSSIGAHWGVLVGEGNSRFLYHLVFRYRNDATSDAKPDSITGRSRPIKFNAILWDDPEDKSVSRKVGRTRYSTDELVKIGRTSQVPFFNQQETV
jgi:hypothetical protein